MTDAMAPLKTMLEQQLGWDSTDYGVFTSGYGWFNIFLLMLIFGGMIPVSYTHLNAYFGSERIRGV